MMGRRNLPGCSGPTITCGRLAAAQAHNSTEFQHNGIGKGPLEISKPAAKEKHAKEKGTT